ncbi:hypothetical protein GOODEAATRI_019355, partial [Goodea atripinnis]
LLTVCRLSGQQADGLINVPQKTVFQQKLQELSESVYASSRKAPLGRGPVRGAELPAWYNDKTTFGVKTVKGHGVREIINPPKATEELEEEAQEGHEAYVRSHNSYFVGEKIDRKYNCSNFNKNSTFGIPTPHFSDGRNVDKTLHWLGESHKFVVFLLVYQKGKGLIDKEDLRAVCHELNLKLSDKVLDELMEDCDTDKDGFINFVEFANFLNWKDKMPINDARTYGIPSKRSDLPAPRIKRISDRTNYGDLSTAADLLHPSVHALRGVHEEHFFCPRTKKEIEEIFRNIGVNISEDTFEEAWKLASMKQPNGEVCVEVFRNTLKEIKVL